MRPLACLLLGLWLASSGCARAPRYPSVVAWDAASPAAPVVESEEREVFAELAKYRKRLRKEELLYENEALAAYLDDLVVRIAPERARNAPALRILVLEDVEHTASALPDGTVLISLPLLVSYPNEAQLAFVLAHEITHVVKRHSLRSLRYDSVTPSHVDRMRLSRLLEKEADTTALELIARAGYDPREAENGLARTIQMSPEAPGGLKAWRSHADPAFRYSVLRSAVDGERRVAPGDGLRAETFERAMDPHRLAAARIALDADNFDLASELVTHHLERRPQEGPAYALRAQITRSRDPGERLSTKVGEDLERAVRFGPENPESLRALGLFLRDTGQRERSETILRRYLAAHPDAFDRKLIERYLRAEID